VKALLVLLAAATACGGLDAETRPAAVVVVPSAPPSTATSTATTAVQGAPPADSAAPAVRAPSPPSTVRLGTQRGLRPVAVEFATYLNAMHNRIHPEFTTKELERLDKLPPTDPLNDPKLVTKLEIVLAGDTGALLKASVMMPSGNVEFDNLALGAMERSAPFAPAGSALRSSDGNVYVHWEFGRDETFGCSTMHVRPYLLDFSRPVASLP
jgi:hypothetical protein